MLSLAIHHNVYLTKEQRYVLHEGIELVVVGVSVPVWVADNRATTEPASEVFCNYYLKNTKDDTPIQILQDGFEITLPNRQGTLPELSEEEWRHLNFHEPDKLDAQYQKCVRRVTSENLLDVPDGGSRYLSFREHNKMKRADTWLNLIHFVNVMDVDFLTESLI